MTPKEVLALIREKEVRAVDLRFMDFPGLWQHFTIPAEELKNAAVVFTMFGGQFVYGSVP